MTDRTMIAPAATARQTCRIGTDRTAGMAVRPGPTVTADRRVPMGIDLTASHPATVLTMVALPGDVLRATGPTAGPPAIDRPVTAVLIDLRETAPPWVATGRIIDHPPVVVLAGIGRSHEAMMPRVAIVSVPGRITRVQSRGDKVRDLDRRARRDHDRPGPTTRILTGADHLIKTAAEGSEETYEARNRGGS